MSVHTPTPTTPTSGIPIDFRRLSWAGHFVCDYWHAFDRLAPFYAGSAASTSTWKRVLAERRALEAAPPDIATVVARQLRARQAPNDAQATAERLREPGTIAVVTGQQAGLFGGPLFNLLKAITTIDLARRVAREHDATVVPVFWIDAEDHNLDEIRTCGVLDDELEFRQITLALQSPPGTTAASVRLDSSVNEAIERLRNLLPPTEFTEATVDGIAAAYTEGVGLVEAFARWLDSLLGPLGLVVFDASDPHAKPLVRSVFERELQMRGETSRLATSSGTELVARGYHAQVDPQARTVALFQLDGTRQPIRIDGADFTVGGAALSSEALLDQVNTRPERFGPNVLLRPIVQDSLFPTVAYVAGPSELVYLGQLRQIYQKFGVPMPIMYPRLSATITDTATLKFLKRYNLNFESLQPRDDTVLNQLLATQLPASVDRAVADTDRTIAERIHALEAAVPTIDPTLLGAVQSTRVRMERDLRNLRSKIIQAAKRRDATLRRQFRRARAQAFPEGQPQERSLAGVFFLNRYGPALVDRLLADLPLDPGHHWLLTL